MSRPIPFRMWVVYDHPSDFPDHFVARLWEGEKVTASIIQADTLEKLQDVLQWEMGLVKLMRFPGDDPVIVETWL